MKYIELNPLPLEVKGNDVVRHCLVKRFNNDDLENEVDLWFQFNKSIIQPNDTDCDSYLLAVLMDAMRESRNIVIKGSVSKLLLSNLVEYQSIWYKWVPHMYSKIEIEADSLNDNESVNNGAVCAYSGGVDATFSVWRHVKKKWSYRSQEIKLCTMVHGFDIPLDNDIAFENSLTTSSTTLKELNLGLMPIKTNCKEISNSNWEHSFMCMLIAALSNFKNMAGTIIVGSGEPYEYNIKAWGSTPVADYLLSADGFSVMHDGASHSRTEKVEEITEWKTGVDSLRVCWEGDLKDSNCGKCEKCLRTQFNFLASCNSLPKCFPVSNIKDLSLKNIIIRNDSVKAEWIQILEMAERNRIKEPWVLELTWLIDKKKYIINFILPKDSYRRLIFRKISSMFNRVLRKEGTS
jgi:hypothetical protein